MRYSVLIILRFSLLYGCLVLGISCYTAEKPRLPSECVRKVTNADRRVLARGPVVQNVTTNSVVIMGRPVESLLDSKVEIVIKTPGGASHTADGRHARKKDTFEIAVKGLPADTLCSYTVKVGGKRVGPFSFRTAPAGIDTPVRFAIYGDTRTYPKDHARVADAIANEQPCFTLCAGDLVTHGKDKSQWDPQYFIPARNLLANVPVFPCLGNHEERGQPYFDLFSLPGNESYYEMVYGPVRIVTVDQYQPYEKGSVQYKWLENVLAKKFKGWTLVQFHKPPFFGINWKRNTNRKVVDNLVPLFEKYGVDLVINGHYHYYFRTVPLSSKAGEKGIIYVISGGGGAPLHSADKDTPYMATTRSAHHYLICDATAGELKCRAMTPEGEEIDRFTLSRKSPPSAHAWPTLVDMIPGLVARLRVKMDMLAAFRKPFLEADSTEYTVTLKNPENFLCSVVAEWQTQKTAWKVKPVRKKFNLKPGEKKTLKVTLIPPAIDKLYPVPVLALTVTVGKQKPFTILEPLPVINRPRGVVVLVKKGPVLDGVLDDPCWKKAEKLELRADDGSGLPPNNTVTRVIAAPDGLYVGVDCAEDDMDHIRDGSRRRDAPIWRDDAVEFIIDPDCDRKTYFHFGVSIAGIMMDRIRDPQWKKNAFAWNGKWSSKVRKGEKGWQVEARVPWSDLGLKQAPSPGTKAGFNVMRNEYSPDSNAENGVRHEWSHWAVTFKGNSPDRFGTLVFKSAGR